MRHSEAPAETEILSYADGWMDADPAAKAAFEARLAKHPELLARATAYRSQTDALRRAYDGRAEEPVPGRLRAALWAPRRAPRPQPGRIAAAAVLLFAATGVGWMAGQWQQGHRSEVASFVEQSLGNFERLEVVQADLSAADGRESLQRLSEDVARKLEAPDLTDIGYRLVDRSVVGGGLRPMVELVYRRQDGKSFSLFLRSRLADGMPVYHEAREGDLSIVFWHGGALESAVVSTLSPEENRWLAEAINAELKAPRAAPAGRGTITLPVPDPRPAEPANSFGGPSDGMAGRPMPVVESGGAGTAALPVVTPSGIAR